MTEEEKEDKTSDIVCALSHLHWSEPFIASSAPWWCHTHQQWDLSISDNVHDVLVLLRLLVQLCSSSSSEPPQPTSPSCTSSCSRGPGLGAVLPAHAAPWQGEHKSRDPWRLHARPLGLGVWVDPRWQQLVWKTTSTITEASSTKEEQRSRRRRWTLFYLYQKKRRGRTSSWGVRRKAAQAGNLLQSGSGAGGGDLDPWTWTSSGPTTSPETEHSTAQNTRRLQTEPRHHVSSDQRALYLSLRAAASQAQRLVVGQSGAHQAPPPGPLQRTPPQVAPRHRALVVGDARQRGHLLTGFDVRHVQDLVHVQIVVLQFPEQSLRVVPSNADAGQALPLPPRPVGGGGGVSWLVGAGVLFTGLPWLPQPQPLTRGFPIRVGVCGLRLVFEGRDSLHRPELTMDLGKPRGFDSPATVGGNPTTPVDGWSCTRKRDGKRLME